MKITAQASSAIAAMRVPAEGAALGGGLRAVGIDEHYFARRSPSWQQILPEPINYVYHPMAKL